MRPDPFLWYRQWLDLVTDGISPWIYGPLITLVWLFVLQLVKKFLLGHLHRIAHLTHSKWIEALLRSISLPLAIVIWGSAFALLGKLIPLPKKWAWLIAIVFQSSLVLALVLAVDRFVKRLIEIYSAHAEGLRLSPGFLKTIARVVVIGLGALIFLDLAGVPITPLLASVGIGSLAVALGLQNTLENFFAGLQIMADKSIREGDFVKLESGDEGYVTEIGWRSTRVRMLPDNTIIIPNRELGNCTVLNYHLPTKQLAVLVPLGVSYTSDLEKVERVTVDVAREVMKQVKGAVPDFDPFIRFHTFGESSINFTVILRAQEFVDQHLVKHEFVKALHKRYREEGIVIPYPLRTLDIPRETLELLRK